MLRVFFPASQEITEAPSHTEIRKEFKSDSKSASAMTLLVRVFSLMTLDETPVPVEVDKLDFDLSLFATYANSYRQMMRFMFQAILYRNFREQRLSMNLAKFQETMKQLAFEKKATPVLGLVMKHTLEAGSIEQAASKFKTSTAYIEQCLKTCGELWLKVKFIAGILANHKSIHEEMFSQFLDAHQVMTEAYEKLGVASYLSD